ncbi:hypothetical protein CVT25_008457 [Psilocybe cyanescens]|uniref:Uncharacterized protein n=1 Tax=Psilocybe cyanescens TaxID=93625 RepID=A0A409WUX8_PSICY|nr:hypothetical protein CVT25_008457 [Psilocybe cyanescens]
MSDNVSTDSNDSASQIFGAATASGNFRALNFISSDLGKDIDLLLMFVPPKIGTLYKDVFPVCWRILSFDATGLAAVTVNYTADSGFLVPQVEAGSLVAASNAQRCNIGQECILMTSEDGTGNYLSPAKDGDGGAMQCRNDTQRPASLGFGYINKAGNKIEPIVMWEDIAKGSTIAAQLYSTLRIYAVTGYKDTGLIRKEIKSPILFEKNLISLASFTEWMVSIDEGTGEVKIEKLLSH